MGFQEMIAPEEAEALIMAALPGYPYVTLPISLCAGRILREPVIADRSQPPFDRVAMDGIAVASAAFARGLRRFPVEGMQKAGEPRRKLGSEEGCLEVMTGAPLPLGADCVIPVEDIVFEEGFARLAKSGNPGKPESAALSAFRHVHRAGSDCAAGEIIVPAGAELTAPRLGAAAAFGFPELKVAWSPSVALIATGDELVDPGEAPAPHQIRRSNPYAIEAALRMRGFDRIEMLHARDDRGRLREAVAGALGRCDILILSGGVSMGKTDYVPGILAELGIEARFHRIRQRPGKPFWFGVGSAEGSVSGKPVFALPGNPASVLVCLHRYVLPALRRAMGGSAEAPVFAALERDSPAPGGLAHFRPVTVASGSDGRLRASYVVNQGSGDFSGWARADGFVELAAGAEAVPAGGMVRFWGW